MTCREKLAIEHPEYVDPDAAGGCLLCPADFLYLDDPDYCTNKDLDSTVRCTNCWNRELPTVEDEYPMLTESVEDPKTTYVIFQERRHIFIEHTYIGWYRP